MKLCRHFHGFFLNSPLLCKSYISCKASSFERRLASQTEQALRLAKWAGYVGKELGVSSAIISGVKFANNRTAGNFLILVANIALKTAGPIGGIASGLLEASGAKDAIGAALDERLEYDNFISQTNQNKAKR